MHTYRWSEPVWAVGYWLSNKYDYGNVFQGDQVWMPLKDFDTEEKAAAYVNFLNGGRAEAAGVVNTTTMQVNRRPSWVK